MTGYKFIPGGLYLKEHNGKPKGFLVGYSETELVHLQGDEIHVGQKCLVSGNMFVPTADTLKYTYMFMDGEIPERFKRAAGHVMRVVNNYVCIDGRILRDPNFPWDTKKTGKKYLLKQCQEGEISCFSCHFQGSDNYCKLCDRPTDIAGAAELYRACARNDRNYYEEEEPEKTVDTIMKNEGEIGECCVKCCFNSHTGCLLAGSTDPKDVELLKYCRSNSTNYYTKVKLHVFQIDGLREFNEGVDKLTADNVIEKTPRTSPYAAESLRRKELLKNISLE